MLRLKKSKILKSKARIKKSNKSLKRHRHPSHADDALKALQTSDLIEVIAPGSYSSREDLEKGVKILESWGYRVRYAQDLLEPQLFLSNTDQKRFQSFKIAMTNSKSKIVWCLRGGYGAIRLLPQLEKMKAPKTKKILIGISDISSLHILLNQKWQFPTLHAPLLDRIGLNKVTPENLNELREVLTNPSYVAKFENLEPLNKAAVKKRTIKAQLTGGNLMVATSTLGTPTQIISKNKILFFEELCERAYRVDRCLQQMRQAGVFDHVKAVVFGDFVNCDEPNKDNHIHQVLKDFFKDLKIPAFTGVEAGHGTRQRPLFFNTEVHLTCGEKPQMLIYSAFKE